ncbi:hypothetical protein [Actinoplanes derwentensis]|uniref:Uncharacterized protein n=1 Tax=Actinoplanes derwentensis TaxID=113562 RepID=A0A1H2D7B8_9ACTN|nr:hypothetical protein [Actinoplanes derwentensis]GID85639.1 hypothetical protein Ade03nite_45630 [Actinoplanes derwentensis]SDT78146.1 hypothetical protein SAMN04489716_8252 [Actinoplanes derwentensis]
MSVRFAPPGGRAAEPPATDDAAAWITGAVPDGWFTEPPEVVVDRDEIIIWGRLPSPELAGDATDADRAASHAGRIVQFREDTRDARIRVARQVEHRYQRKVAWGVRCGDASELFTHLSAPVMTRLRQPERQVLDTLVDAGVARSRSEALAWCVKLVGRHTEDWLGELRIAMTRVEELRRQGPDA